MSPLGNTNLLNLSKNGAFRDSGEHKSEPAHVDAMFAELKQQADPHLVIYFHGGLVSEAGGFQTAQDLYPLFAERVGAHPLFVVWESGGLEIVKNNLAKLADTPLFKELLNALLKFTVSKLQSAGAPGRALGDKVDLVSQDQVDDILTAELAGVDGLQPEQREQMEPLSEDQERQFRKLLENSNAFQNAADEVANAVGEAAEGRGLGGAEAAGAADLQWFDAAALQALESEVAGEDESGRGLVTTTFLINSGIGILTRVVKRFINHTDHGVAATVTEELLRQFYLDKVGGWLWGQMKATVAESFASNTGLSGDLLHGGTYLLERMNDFISDPASPPLKVSLVGHSAGSIYISELYKAALSTLPATFKFNKVAFLAPGVDFELFKEAIVDHPERMESFVLYTMNDDLESKDAILGPVYPRSILYLVSGALEGKEEALIVGLERFYTRKQHYDTPLVNAVRAFIMSADPQRVVWSSTSGAAPGFNCIAEHHMGFSEEATTQDNLAALLTA